MGRVHRLFDGLRRPDVGSELNRCSGRCPPARHSRRSFRNGLRCGYNEVESWRGCLAGLLLADVILDGVDVSPSALGPSGCHSSSSRGSSVDMVRRKTRDTCSRIERARARACAGETPPAGGRGAGRRLMPEGSWTRRDDEIAFAGNCQPTNPIERAFDGEVEPRGLEPLTFRVRF